MIFEWKLTIENFEQLIKGVYLNENI